MNKIEIFNKLKELNLDKDKYVVISGASLVAHDIIKNTNDIDMCCSLEFFNTINWKTKIGAMGKIIKYFDIYEISNNLYEENMKVDIIDGYKFMNINDCYLLKKKINREKDKKILMKLDNIMKKIKFYN